MPCWVAFSVGFCVIKYSEGYVFLPEIGGRCAVFQGILLVLMRDLVIPKPYQFWSQPHRKAVLPLYLCISIAWGTEM